MHPRLSTARTWERVAALGTVTTVVVLGVAVMPASAAPRPAAGKPPAPATPAAPTSLTEGQALARARATGMRVAITSATTPTETLTANPDGHLTLTRSAMPTRRMVNGTWADLDATLHVRPDGTISPAVASSDLTLSAGGTGPLATLSGSGYRLALSMPMALPTPTLAGATATYRNIIPDVDLVATATQQGGFSEVVVVRSAAAAADPRLSTLKLATKAAGVTLTSDAAGNITGVDKLGRVVVAAPAPQLWDSRATAGGSPARIRNAESDPNSPLPPTSTADGPGVNAQHAALGVRTTATAITLTPDKSLMSSPTLTYPVYLDPSFVQPTVSNHYSGWSTINKAYASTNYWDSTPDPHPEKDMQVGTPDETDFISRSLMNFPIPYSTLGAAGNVSKATLQVNEDWSYSCSARTVDLYAPASATLTSVNAYWNAWAGVSLGSAVDSANVAHGYNSSCPNANVGFDVLSTVRTDVTAKKATQTFMLKAADETDKYGWKEFTHPSSSVGPILTIEYNHPPNTPVSLGTNPSTNCAGTPAIGLGPVSISAKVSDPDNGTVGATFTVKNHNTGAVVQTSDPQVTHATSGGTVSFALDQNKLTSSANGTPTRFDFTVTATDYKATSGSASCYFVLDPTKAGKPNILQNTADPVIGQPASFTASPSSSVVPAFYLVQVNGGAPVKYAATSGSLTFSVTPTGLANVLTVTATSTTGANIGQPSDDPFNADAPATPSADQDLNGDGVPDLLTAGGPGTVLPSGLWMTPGSRDVGVEPRPTDIGMQGDGIAGDQLPADFNGARAISGVFNPGADGLQDVLVYEPQGAAKNAGGGEILDGNGDGSALDPVSGFEHNISAGALDDSFDYQNEVSPVQLVNAGNTSGRGNPYPDLIGIGGDTTSGYNIWYYSAESQPGVYDGPTPLTGVTTPTGGTDWNTWTLAAAQIGGHTSLYLWQKSTGALYLWNNLVYDGTTLTYDTPISFGTWTGGTDTIQAADIDGNGTADLWTLGAGGVILTWLNNGTSLTSLPRQVVPGAAHAWNLAEGTDDNAAITTAADSIGDATATGAGGVTWNTDLGVFSPDASFNGTSGALTAAKVIDTTADFTISAWAKLNAYDGTVISQDGTNGPGFRIWSSGADDSWNFAMQQSDKSIATAVQDIAKSPANTAKLGLWYHLTASYQASTKRMVLIVNGVQAGARVHTTPWAAPAGSKLQIGRTQSSAGVYGTYFNGELATIETWSSVVPPLQLADWDMAGGSGTTVSDVSGFGATATLTGGYTWNTTGHNSAQNGSITFNGSTGYATANAALLQPATTSFSVAAWVYLTDTAGTVNRVAISQPGTNRSPFYLVYNSVTNSWALQFTAADVPTNPTEFWADDPNPAARNTWVHLAGTYDADTHTARLYVNGKLVATTTGITTWNSTKPTWIGRSGATWWQGKLDSVLIYQGVLSPAQVQQAMAG